VLRFLSLLSPWYCPFPLLIWDLDINTYLILLISYWFLWINEILKIHMSFNEIIVHMFKLSTKFPSDHLAKCRSSLASMESAQSYGKYNSKWIEGIVLGTYKELVTVPVTEWSRETHTSQALKTKRSPASVVRNSQP
jgi:hypothetical protein